MASLNMDFDPNAVEPDKGGGGLHPEGDFQFEIEDSDVTATSNGKGQVLKLTLVGVGDDNKGLRVWDNINLLHESAQAQAIGQAKLSALCRACDFVEQLTDSEQLHYRPFWARIKHEQQIDFKTKAKLYHPDGSPKLRAVVTRYLFDDGEAPAQSAPPAGKPQPQAANNNAAPPQQATGTGGAASRPWLKR